MPLATIGRHFNDGFEDKYRKINEADKVIALVKSARCNGAFPEVVKDDTGFKWRVDTQKDFESFANIQIQRNGVRGEKSTIGGIFVPKLLFTEILSLLHPDEIMRTQAISRDAEFTRIVRRGLLESVATWQRNPYSQFQFFEIIGQFSN